MMKNITCYIEDELLVIKNGFSFQKIQLDRITKIISSEQIRFLENDNIIGAVRWSVDNYMMALKIYEQYPCKELEIQYPKVSPYGSWNRYYENEYKADIQKNMAGLEKIIDEYRNKVPFSIHHEVEFSAESKGTVLKIWGEDCGERVMLHVGKECLPWEACVTLAVPCQLSKDTDRSIYAVNNECEKALKTELDHAIYALECYRMGKNKHPNDMLGVGILCIQLFLIFSFICLPYSIAKCLVVPLFLVVLGFVLYIIIGKKRYDWKLQVANLLLGAFLLILFAVWVIQWHLA